MKKYTHKMRRFFPNFKEELHGGVKEQSIWIIIGQILTIISAVLWCLTIIGLIWGLPMILGCLKRLHKTQEVTIWHIIISFVFYFFWGAIFTLIGAVAGNRLHSHNHANHSHNQHTN